MKTIKQLMARMDAQQYWDYVTGCDCASCRASRKVSSSFTKIIQESGMKLLMDATPRTQKAKGLKAIWAAGKKDYHITPLTFLVQGNEDIPLNLPGVGEWFARPCPTRPRPGFVESRVITTAAQLAAVYDETRAEDPMGEVLVMPFVEAIGNVCITPGLMSVGPGHDGATAGHDSEAFPINVGMPKWLELDAVASTIAKGEVPHCEVVLREGGYPLWVQARSGPPAPTGVGADYVPAAAGGVSVTKVVDVGDTPMLEWEAIAKTMTTGEVAYGKGHTMGSHAALHCLASGVPFFTSYRPKVGDTLIPTPPPAYDLDSIIEGIGAGIMWEAGNSPLQDQRKMCLAILYGLHHASALQGSAGFYLGLAGALMFKFGMSAGEGELGIHNSNVPYQVNGKPSRSNGAAGCFCSYQNVVTRPYKTLGVHRDFLLEHCESHFCKFNSSGISGQNWGRCVYSLFALDRALQSIVRSKGETNRKAIGVVVDALIIALNKAVDQAHNGAWWLNKFGVQENDFLGATNGEWNGLVEIANMLWSMEQDRGKMLTRRRRVRAASWYGAMKSLQPPTMTLGEVSIGGVLNMSYKWPGCEPRSHAIPASIKAMAPKPAVKVRRQMVDTRLDLIFYVDSPLGVIDLYTEHFELEQDPRKVKKVAAAAAKKAA